MALLRAGAGHAILGIWSRRLARGMEPSVNHLVHESPSDPDSDSRGPGSVTADDLGQQEAAGAACFVLRRWSKVVTKRIGRGED